MRFCHSYPVSSLPEVPCHSKEEEGVTIHSHGVEELSPCSVITGYSFMTRTQRLYKLLISVNETEQLKEYSGDVNMKVYISKTCSYADSFVIINYT